MRSSRGAQFTEAMSPDFDPSQQLPLSAALAPRQACSGLNGGPPARDFPNPLAVAGDRREKVSVRQGVRRFPLDRAA